WPTGGPDPPRPTPSPTPRASTGGSRSPRAPRSAWPEHWRRAGPSAGTGRSCRPAPARRGRRLRSGPPTARPRPPWELLARYRATEFGPAGVRVTAVSPGPVRTEAAEAVPGDRAALMDGTDAHGRAGDPGGIAGVDSFLAGPAGSYVNGAVLLADGGEPSALPA
ncbi:LOW QUALITY PROTEIN: short chain dehydrogenase/reductase family oxidoreductase, partial [Streptomyces sp. e14]